MGAMIDGQDDVDNSARDDSTRESRLARRRELYRIHRADETPDQSEQRLARCREYVHRTHANIAHSGDERQCILQ